MSLSIDLRNRVALVTGGGTGLGRAGVDALVAAGATVVIAGRRPDVLERAAREAGAQAMACDASDPDATRDLVHRIVAEHGQLDILVNAAGLNIRGDFVRIRVQRLGQGARDQHARTVLHVAGRRTRDARQRLR